MTGEGLVLTVVADTHVPKRARDLPPQVWSAVESADVVVHAGDWVAASLLDEFVTRSRRLVGVWGNNDGPELRRRLPQGSGHSAIVDVRSAAGQRCGLTE
jgi:putative phosphoesterase